jgi:hypothetical protein
MTEEESPAEPIVGNKRIEDAAIRFVVEQERQMGREAADTRYRGAAADLESAGRTIEVKAVGGLLRGYGLRSSPGSSRRLERTRTSTSTSLRTWPRVTLQSFNCASSVATSSAAS